MAVVQPALIIGMAGMLAGVLMAVFSVGLSRLPAWQHGRRFALVALTCAGYCAFDLAMVVDLSTAAVAFGVQVALLFGVAHGLAWLWYLAALEGRPFDRYERAAAVVGVLVGIAGLIPGTIVTAEVVTIRVAWAGAAYRVPRPTTAGVLIYGYLALTMSGVAIRALRRRPYGDRSRLVAGGVAVLGLLAVNDTLVTAGRLSMPMLLDAGSVLVVLVTGIVSQRRLADELTRTQEALARSERLVSVSRLATGIAHEINNPAAVIRHALEQIRDSRDELPRHVDHALTAVDRIVYVVRQLLDLGLASRPGSATLGPFAVAPVVARASAAVATRFKPGALTIDVAPDLCAFGDALRVEAVLVSLLSNAAHAVESWAAPHASVRAMCEDARVTITVTDNGPGLPPAVLNRLFEPFVTARPFGQGAGLGLAVAHGLMRSQNGGLRLVRTSEEGTELAIHLPKSAGEPGPAAAIDAPAPDDAPTLGLLIIDDDPDLRMVLQEAAEAHRFRASVAATVAEALRMVEAGVGVDIVLCDIMMPDGGADTWLRLCRERYPALAARTIVITGGPSSTDALALADANADRLLYKPFAMTDVRAMAMRLIQK